MFPPNSTTSLGTNTPHKAVLPFYIYASLALLCGCVMLFCSAGAFTQHYFHPHTLAITHMMALGWGTMMILGAGHQLIPVLIEAPLHSKRLAQICFTLAATGIPLLVHGFYTFTFSWPAQTGGIFINLAIIIYLINFALSLAKSKHENVHAVFAFTATLWLLLTAVFGLLLLYNFTHQIFAESSLHYLSQHANMGIAGWFLLMVIGVGSRLIPMFMISKYNQPKILWIIYALINISLAGFLMMQLYFKNSTLDLVPLLAILIALLLFGFYCKKAYDQRIRKKLDTQMKLSLLSVLLMAVPVIVLSLLLQWQPAVKLQNPLVLLYGFSIFFGWLTALIFGMTFKTLPFIIWNKVYHARAGLGKTPNPKDLFSSRFFSGMTIFYFAGFVLFATGVFSASVFIIKIGAALLFIAALLYNGNVFKIIFHKPSPL